MNRNSLADLAKNGPMEALLEKEERVRAYELYEQRGRGDGFALQDCSKRRPKSWLDFSITDPSANHSYGA